MIEQLVTIRNALGLHARPAGVLSQAANQFSSSIYIQKGLMKVNAKEYHGNHDASSEPRHSTYDSGRRSRRRRSC